MKLARALVLIACLAPSGCVITTQAAVSGQPSPVVYYYGGAHFYPDSLGGEWCPIDQPHAHDFAPDHPEFYSHEHDFYYYVGRPAQPHVVGRTPPDARVHVVHTNDPHGATRIPPGAPIAPHVATGRIPTRDTSPAPAQPIPARPPTTPGRAPTTFPRPASRVPTQHTDPGTVRGIEGPKPLPRRGAPRPGSTPGAPAPGRTPDPRDPRDDNAQRVPDAPSEPAKRTPDPRDPRDDKAEPAPEPRRATPPGDSKTPRRVPAPLAPRKLPPTP